jgi:Spy/CpxP family protein refolding chaperone
VKLVLRNLLGLSFCSFNFIILWVQVAGAAPTPGDASAIHAAPPGVRRFGPGYERLVAILTAEQRASLQAAMETNRDKVRELEERLRLARRALLESALTGKFEESVVRLRATAVAELEADLTVVRFKAFSQMRPPLSGKQLQELASTQGADGPTNAPSSTKKEPFPRDEHGLPPKERLPTEPPN